MREKCEYVSIHILFTTGVNDRPRRNVRVFARTSESSCLGVIFALLLSFDSNCFDVPPEDLVMYVYMCVLTAVVCYAERVGHIEKD
jgi:hypothetical protein